MAVYRLTPVVTVVEYLINHDTSTKNRYIILVFNDVDPVTVGPVPVALADRGDPPARSTELEFVLPERAVNFVIVWSGNIEGEFLFEPGEFLDDFGEQVSIDQDLVTRLERKQLLADESQFVPLAVLKRQLVTPGESLTIDQEAGRSELVGDRKIVSPRPELLFDSVNQVMLSLNISSNVPWMPTHR